MHLALPCLHDIRIALAIACAGFLGVPAPAAASAARAAPFAAAGTPCIFADGIEQLVAGTWSQPGGAGNLLTYLTSGGWTLKIHGHTITITDPLGMNTVQHWGDPHENLNGKHIKDWDGTRRSLLLDDGTHVTMEANGPHGLVLLTSIYDGHANLQLDNATTTVLHESLSLADTRCRERLQHDGETSLFSSSALTGVGTYSHIYREDEAFQRTPDTRRLGTTGGYANPHQVNDLYDDPRFPHT